MAGTPTAKLQVVEHFREGLSHGIRTKWNLHGTNLSEGEIVDGKFHGIFRRWSERGSLIDQVVFVLGQPDGDALTYFESGFIKEWRRMRDGKIVEQKSWQDRERKNI
jgi:antitoxin component YwqK of YwqJK toxin-antitoxin module